VRPLEASVDDLPAVPGDLARPINFYNSIGADAVRMIQQEIVKKKKKMRRGAGCGARVCEEKK
jgi:hypothetical protein